MANQKCTVKARYIGGKVFSPDEVKNQYSAVLILEEGEEEKIYKIRDKSIAEKWGSKKPKLEDWTVREGDDEEFENSFGHLFINPKANRKPRLYTKQGGQLTEFSEEDDILYAGCYVYAVVDCYAYAANKEKQIKAGVTMGLENMVFWKHGEALGYSNDADVEDYADMESEMDDMPNFASQDDDDDLI